MEIKNFFGKKELAFIIKFFIIFFALQFLLLALPLAPLKNFIAATEANALGTAFEENKIILESQNFEITENCTGLLSGIILAAVIFSVKKPDLKTKFVMAITGATALFLLNFPRIHLVLLAAQKYGSETAALLHEITWITTAALILIIWFFAVKKIAKIKNFAEMI